MDEVNLIILGNKEPATIINNGDGTYDVTYVPNLQGQMSVNVSYDGKPVPGRLESIIICYNSASCLYNYLSLILVSS